MNEFIMSPERRSPEDDRLDELFRAYRSCEPVEVSANFMPELWQKIDRVQSNTFFFRKIARGFLTAATALSLVMAMLVAAVPSWHTSPVYNATYVEILADHSDTPDAVDVTSADSAEEVEEI